MKTEFHDGIELITAEPEGPARPASLLFVHGAFVGAWVWQEHYLPYFASRGWTSHALSLSGHGGSQGREWLDQISLQQYVQDVRRIIARMPTRPVIIGHSMGGMVAQKVLEHEDAPAVVLMSSVPPAGLFAATAQMLMSRPNLLAELNRALNGAIPQLESLREALFHQPISDEVLLAYMLRMHPESTRAVWDMSCFDLPSPARMHRPPMLVLGAEHDNLVPASQTQHTASAYDTDAHIFPDIGHGMMLEAGWQATAEHIADWLIEQGF